MSADTVGLTTHILGGTTKLPLCRTNAKVIGHGGATVADCLTCLRIEAMRAAELENQATNRGLYNSVVAPSEREAVDAYSRARDLLERWGR